MKRWVIVFAILAAMALPACDGPDEIYTPLPENYDPATANGLKKAAVLYDGLKGFLDETREVITVGPSVETCTDTELNDKWSAMVSEPIIPLKGAGGLDMRGGDDWSGLTVDDAQSKEMLCQPSYFADGVVAWGDNFEVIAFFDTSTRLIFDILVLPGYMGTIEAPPYSFAVNAAIKKDTTFLNRKDGSARDPRTEENMRDINRALLRTFRTSVADPDSVDCVDSGSCFVITSGTLPILIFIDVGLYLPLEPTNMRIYDIETALKRPFDFNRSSVAFDGPGVTMSGVGSCSITYGTTWDHILTQCIGSDPVAMVNSQPADSYERLWTDLGGVSVWLKRDLADDEIIMLGDTARPTDTVTAFAFDESYEGPINLPFAPTLQIFKQKLMDRVAEEAGLAPTDLTGVETLRWPGDADLPTSVSDRYRDRLPPRGVRAAFCTDDGPDPDTRYDSCMQDSDGNILLPLMKTLDSLVATALTTRITPALRERTFYAQIFIESYFEYVNGEPLVPNQAKFSPSSSAETIIGNLTMVEGGENYTMDTQYDGLDDRFGPIYYYKGANRPESVLYRDAALPTPSDPAPTGVFLFDRLLLSTRLGLGSSLITIQEVVPDIRRAIINFPMSETETMTVLAPYVEASTTIGYWIPVKGAVDVFTPSDVITLYGHTILGELFLVPSTTDPGKKEVVGIYSADFFGSASFCGQSVQIGDRVEDIMAGIVDMSYPCTMIINWSENGEFMLAMASMEDKKRLYVDNEKISAVFAWER